MDGRIIDEWMDIDKQINRKKDGRKKDE